MLRTIISFAAGFVVAKFTSDSKFIEKTQKSALENYEKIKSTSKKVAGVVKEEFSSKETPVQEKS